MSENFSKKITFYNFAMTMLMVLYHWKNFSLLALTPEGADLRFINILYRLYDSLGALSLGTFFLMSGFLLYYGCSGTDDLKRKFKKRIKTLLIPFAVWNLLYFIYIVLRDSVKGRLSLNIKDIILGFTFSCYNGPLWYLLALIMLLFLSPLVLKLREKKVLALSVLSVVSIVCVLITSFVGSSNLFAVWFLRLSFYIPLYFVGAVAALVYSDKVVNEVYRKPVFVIIASLLSIAIAVYFAAFTQKAPIFNGIIKYIWVITVWGAIGANVFSKLKVTAFVKNNFIVFALHSVLIGIINTIFNRIFGAIIFMPWITVIIHFGLIALLYFISLAFALICQKILPKKIYFALSGGR